MNKLRVFLADDHAVVRAGLKLLVDAQPDMEVVGEAANGEEACRAIAKLRPDVAVMDISMPEVSGAQATERLRVLCPEVKILVLSAYDDEAHVRQLLTAGASGYVRKRSIAEELTGAIRAVAAGGSYLDPSIAGHVVSSYIKPARSDRSPGVLSPREQEVLVEVARGYTNKEIAERLHLSVKTVEGHKARILQKLDLPSRAGIVRYALQHGWLQEE